MQSLAEWKFGSGNVRHTQKKQKVDYEPHRPTAARLITFLVLAKLIFVAINKRAEILFGQDGWILPNRFLRVYEPTYTKLSSINSPKENEANIQPSLPIKLTWLQ